MQPLDFSSWGLVLQMAGVAIIAGFVAAAAFSLVRQRNVVCARLLVAEGVIGGLGVMSAATLLRSIELRTWKQILMFSLVVTLRILLKKLFVGEKTRLLAESEAQAVKVVLGR